MVDEKHVRFVPRGVGGYVIELDGEGIKFGTSFGDSESTRIGNCPPTVAPTQTPTFIPSSRPSMEPTTLSPTLMPVTENPTPSSFERTTEAPTTIFGEVALENQFVVGGSAPNPIPIPETGTSGSTSITITITGDEYDCPIEDIDVFIRLQQ